MELIFDIHSNLSVTQGCSDSRSSIVSFLRCFCHIHAFKTNTTETLHINPSVLKSGAGSSYWQLSSLRRSVIQSLPPLSTLEQSISRDAYPYRIGKWHGEDPMGWNFSPIYLSEGICTSNRFRYIFCTPSKSSRKRMTEVLPSLKLFSLRKGMQPSDLS